MAIRFRLLGRFIVAAAGLPGGDACMARMMAEAPNHGRTVKPADGPTSLSRFVGASGQLAVPVCPPEETLRCWVFEPTRAAAAKATILVLHGYLMNSFWMQRPTKRLARAGYRVVAVDSRGHGGSSGGWVGYGGQESRDLLHVADRMERDGLIARGRLGVFGLSMGAATAVQYAAIDRRLGAAVAIAPYTSYDEVAPHATRALATIPLPGWSDARLRAAMKRADAASPLSFADADALAAAPAITAPTLLLHGTRDRVIPPDHSARIAAANPRQITHEPLPACGHFLLADLRGRHVTRAIAWFDRVFADGRGAARPERATVA